MCTTSRSWDKGVLTDLCLTLYLSYFMQSEILLPCSQSPPFVPGLRQNPIHAVHPFSLISILVCDLCVDLQSGLFLSGFLTKTVHAFTFSPVCATYPANFILQDFITAIKFGEWHKSRTSSLCYSLMSYLLQLK